MNNPHGKQDTNPEAKTLQRKLLWTVLLINFGFFIIEMATGLVSKSMGLVADSLDMLADAFVYGISLLAVGGTMLMKRNTARMAGILQFILAIAGFAEVIRRFTSVDTIPDYRFMIFISVFALIGNATCLYLLKKSESNEAHIRASKIFTENDVLINLGVITAGLLVMWLHSKLPDLVIGSIVFMVVFKAAVKIYRLGSEGTGC
jgi:Co/Zn/Cd efflux system component